MTESEKLTAQQLAEFSENYLEKVFYYCLKRTGSSFEAEDLSSDIGLHIVAALRRGTVPVNFSAWVWQIARNRYSKWADRKRRYRESVAGTDISEQEIICGDCSAEDELIHQEELSLLRRELSFISSDYRDIIVAYYIDDRKIQNIAISAGLSEGTVKSKLFRARKKLKEGMNMAREFGVKSFKPENVSFAASGCQPPSGLPWSVLGRKLPKNILLEASGNPSTIEELSIELGTAVPYMEEEVDLLVKATLLKKVDGKYITNFFIFDKESQLAIYDAQRGSSQARSEMIGIIARDCLPLLRSLGIVRNDMDDNDLMWWAVPTLANYCITQSRSFHLEWPEKRGNGEDWGIVGYEQANLPENCFLDDTSYGDGNNMLRVYRFRDFDFWNRDVCAEWSDVMFLADVIRNGRSLSSFSASEQKQWASLENRFAHADQTGKIIPDILVIYSDDMAHIRESWKSHPLYKPLMENIQDTFDQVIGILRKCANPILHRQLSYCASMKMFDCGMMTVRDEVNSGRLVPPEDPFHSKAAMWMALTR